eukprot:651651-Heterocapsa_arctica.AAC.1
MPCWSGASSGMILSNSLPPGLVNTMASAQAPISWVLATLSRFLGIGIESSSISIPILMPISMTVKLSLGGSSSYVSMPRKNVLR